MYRNVVLAIPRASCGKYYSGYSYVPYGPLKLLAYAKAQLPEVTFKLINGGHFSDEESFLKAILECNPDLVGISTHTTLAYPDCLRLYKKLQEGGVNCVFGGLHVSYLPTLSVANQRIEVIQGQAFDGFVGYVRGDRKEIIPNLVWRQNDIVHQNPIAPWQKFDELPLIDSSFVRIEDYWKDFRDFKAGTPPFHEKCFTIFTHEGCTWRDRNKGGCEFCNLPLKAYFPNPEYVWREIQKVVQEYGPNVFLRDYGDSLTGNWEYVKELVRTRPSPLRPYKDYALDINLGTRHLKEEWQVDLLKTLGVFRAFVGYESFSNRILHNMRKGATIEMHWRATELLVSHGIYIIAGCVLGCTGEDKESLKETTEGFRQLKKFCGDKLFVISASPIAVLPESRAFNKLLALEPKHGLTDNIDFIATRRDWFKHFVNLGSPEEAEKILIGASLELTRLCPLESFYGFSPEET